MGKNKLINKGHFLCSAIRFTLHACSIRMSKNRNLYVDAVSSKSVLFFSHLHWAAGEATIYSADRIIRGPGKKSPILIKPFYSSKGALRWIDKHKEGSTQRSKKIPKCFITKLNKASLILRYISTLKLAVL